MICFALFIKHTIKYNIVLPGMHSISFRLKILQQKFVLASKICQLDLYYNFV